MGPHMDGLYVSFDTDTRPERLADALPGDTLTRLPQLEGTGDPGNVLRSEFPIPTADDVAVRSPEAAALPV